MGLSSSLLCIPGMHSICSLPVQKEFTNCGLWPQHHPCANLTPDPEAVVGCVCVGGGAFQPSAANHLLPAILIKVGGLLWSAMSFTERFVLSDVLTGRDY